MLCGDVIKWKQTKKKILNIKSLKSTDTNFKNALSDTYSTMIAIKKSCLSNCGSDNIMFNVRWNRTCVGADTDAMMNNSSICFVYP